MVDQWASHLIFQSTLLMRGATMRRFASVPFRQKFQSTLLMRGATGTLEDAYKASRISIHAPHARSDAILARLFADALQISIHAPHARSDHCRAASRRASCQFQSTLLMRGATQLFCLLNYRYNISIHAPHARSDKCRSGGPMGDADFNPRSSCEERRDVSAYTKILTISIHAPHARSDR